MDLVEILLRSHSEAKWGKKNPVLVDILDSKLEDLPDTRQLSKAELHRQRIPFVELRRQQIPFVAAVGH